MACASRNKRKLGVDQLLIQLLLFFACHYHVLYLANAANHRLQMKRSGICSPSEFALLDAFLLLNFNLPFYSFYYFSFIKHYFLFTYFDFRSLWVLHFLI